MEVGEIAKKGDVGIPQGRGKSVRQEHQARASGKQKAKQNKILYTLNI